MLLLVLLCDVFKANFSQLFSPFFLAHSTDTECPVTVSTVHFLGPAEIS